MNLTQFQQAVAAADKPIIVDFWAPWCAPCRATKPVLEKLAAEFNASVTFLSINADDSRAVLEHFRVSGIPTVLALRGGQVTARVTGAQGEAGYRALFDALANDREVQISISAFDRGLRLGAGILLATVGLSTGSWPLLVIGGLVTFLGMYDRCPLWRAMTGMWRAR
jgi:thioredoxin